MITQREFKRNISRGKINSLYYFGGDNTNAIEDALAELKSVLFHSSRNEFDCNSFDADIHAPLEVLNAVKTFPLSSPKRLVVVRRADTWNPKQWKEFHNYFAKPSAQCCLVFIGGIINLKKDKRFELFQKAGTIVSFAKPNLSEFEAFIQKRMSEYGKRISRPAIRYLLDTIGQNSNTICCELDKVALYCGSKERIDKDDLACVLSGTGKNTVFKLVEAIGKDNIDDALSIVQRLLASGSEPLAILGMIARHFRILALAREGICSGDNDSQIGDRICRGVPTFKKWDTRTVKWQAKKWTYKRIARAFKNVSLCDVMLKSSKIDKKIILEHLIIKLSSLGDYPAL